MILSSKGFHSYKYLPIPVQNTYPFTILIGRLGNIPYTRLFFITAAEIYLWLQKKCSHRAMLQNST